MSIPIWGGEGEFLALFVDIDVDITYVKKFRCPGDESKYIVCPIIVQPRNFPNLYVGFPLCEPDMVKRELERTKNLDHVESNDIAEFDPYSYDGKTATFVFSTEMFDGRRKLIDLAESLNLLGIGIFAGVEGNPGSDVTSYQHAPYSMEIVNRLIYCPEKDDSDWDLPTLRMMEKLLFPLKPAVVNVNVPVVEHENRRKFFICKYIMERHGQISPLEVRFGTTKQLITAENK